MAQNGLLNQLSQMFFFYYELIFTFKNISLIYFVCKFLILVKIHYLKKIINWPKIKRPSYRVDQNLALFVLQNRVFVKTNYSKYGYYSEQGAQSMAP